MKEDVGEFKIAVDDFMFDESVESGEDLAEVPEDLAVLELFDGFELGFHVTTVTVLKDQIVVVRGFFKGEELHDMGVIASFKHFDLVLQ